jgi:DNA repair exonuclease SbcCD ATPase subunit
MSLVIRNIALDGFRKFRTPFQIDGLTHGLNIVIEPNETGKSTLLEALRAGFFVRHSTKNQQAQSYVPHGEAVGPEIRIGFDVDGAPWTITKRFIRSATVEVTGPQGRAHGEEAEARLNSLLGSVRDTSRGGDISTYGTLGLLWVGQTEALSVTAPGQIVRDSIASTLEAEVGSIMGGEAYRRVRERVETQFDLYWTPTGLKKGRQNEARDRAETSEVTAREAVAKLAALERSFGELEAARSRLKTVQRAIADDTELDARRNLAASLDVARAAAQILSTRNAEQEVAAGRLSSLSDLKERHENAMAARGVAVAMLQSATERRKAFADTLFDAKTKAATARTGLDVARSARSDARAALVSGEERVGRSRRRIAIEAARGRHGDLLKLEDDHRTAKAVAASAVSAARVAALEESDRAVASAQAVLDAGATRIILSGKADGVTLDGEALSIGERVLTREVRIRFGEAELLVSPPSAAGSAEETLASATRKRKAALDELGVADLAEVRARNESARDAAAELRTLEARITATTPADATLELVAGAEALKLLIATLPEHDGDGDGDLPDVAVLTEAVEAADRGLARAEGAHDSAIEELRAVEAKEALLATAEAKASSDLANAQGALDAIEARQEWATLDDDLAKAREGAAAAAVGLEEAKRNATAHDVEAINRKIEVIDARMRASTEARLKLENEISRLEGTIESEGGLGLADRSAAAQEEAEAARLAHQRVTDEADTVKMLRDTLEAARAETSAKFVGPVAKRAQRYIAKLLPDCEPTFSEDLALESVLRGGIGEDCGTLSRGTQEQLAVLTRIAFADMLLDQGKPVSLILDDPLVYSDDGRLDTMIDILSHAATRMQVILLTCRDRAFRHVPGNRIQLKP